MNISATQAKRDSQPDRSGFLAGSSDQRYADASEGSRAPDRRAGFTLIEILVVVAVLAILAAIAIPNLNLAQTRGKVARVVSDMRSFATAIEAYRVETSYKTPTNLSANAARRISHGDTKGYPNRQHFPWSSPAQPRRSYPDTYTRYEDMRWFTTPVAYITKLPTDIFQREQQVENQVAPVPPLIDYFPPNVVLSMRKTRLGADADDGNSGWLLVSYGPDETWGHQFGHFVTRPASPETWMHDYDPINGTRSRGNIYRFQKASANALNTFTR